MAAAIEDSQRLARLNEQAGGTMVTGVSFATMDPEESDGLQHLNVILKVLRHAEGRMGADMCPSRVDFNLALQFCDGEVKCICFSKSRANSGLNTPGIISKMPTPSHGMGAMPSFSYGGICTVQFLAERQTQHKFSAAASSYILCSCRLVSTVLLL